MHCLGFSVALLESSVPHSTANETFFLLTLPLCSPPASLPLCHTALCSQALPATPALTRIFSSSFLISLSVGDLQRSFLIAVVFSTYNQSIKVQRKQLKEESSFCLTTHALPPISLKKKKKATFRAGQPSTNPGEHPDLSQYPCHTGHVSKLYVRN